jgi:hypothetical protein
MSEIPATDALGLAPEPPAGPKPVDADTAARAAEDHALMREQLYSSEEPSSFYYRKPEAAARARAEFDAKFNATMARYSVVAPVPETPEQLREKAFNENWSLTMPPALIAELDQRIIAAEGLSKDEQAKAIADMQQQMGRALMERRGPASLPNTQQGRDAFVASAGGAEYAELVRNARIVNPKLSDAALSDKHTLDVYAAHGKYQAARDRARGNT